MSVLLKGIGIPKDGEHPYWVTIHSDGIVEYNENKGQGWQTSEAVSVSPHGDLIDRDEAVRDLRMDYAYSAAKIVSLQPTIIPAEEEPVKDTNVPTTYDLLYEEGGYNSNGV